MVVTSNWCNSACGPRRVWDCIRSVVSTKAVQHSLKSEFVDKQIVPHIKHPFWAFLDCFTGCRWATIAVVSATLLGAMGIAASAAVSLLAAIASLGMYTFIAPLLAAPEYGSVKSITPYLWVWGVGGIAGSVLIGPLADRVRGPALTLGILLILTVALLALPLAASWHAWRWCPLLFFGGRLAGRCRCSRTMS